MHDWNLRRDRLRHRLALESSEAILVTNIKNVFYLTGFTGSSAWLLVTADGQVLFSDSRYETQLAEQCPELDCEIRTATTRMVESLSNRLASMKVKALRYESSSLTKAEFDSIDAGLPQVELVSTDGVVEQQRSVKDESEITAIRKSIRINERAFEAVRYQLRPGQTELEISHQLENQMRNFGAKGFSFDAIIGVGKRAALPHGFPGLTTIDQDPLLLIDWGARVDHYVSDLTRVLVLQKKIPDKIREIYEIVLAAQQAAIDAIHPGAELKAVDAAARSVIENAGYGKFFGHGTGHGMGLDLHEAPSLSPICDGKLEIGNVVTVEPGIYLPDWGGVRIEDDLLVTGDGHEVLSCLPKELDACVVDLY